MPLLKILGLLTVFSISSILGFMKSSALSKRSQKLYGFSKGMSTLAERIRMGSGEINELLKISFDSEQIGLGINGISVNEDYLKTDDVSLIKEFFEELGMNNIDSEYERTASYKTLIEIQRKSAEDDCNNLCRLYKTLGVLIGVFICIFLL